jgi:hypothetical protein
MSGFSKDKFEYRRCLEILKARASARDERPGSIQTARIQIMILDNSATMVDLKFWSTLGDYEL